MPHSKRAISVAGPFPSCLQAVEQALFDGGGDVGVGLLDFVLEDVAEAEGLGDFGDAVVDHPGFVAVAKAVEGEARFGGLEAGLGMWRLPSAAGRKARREKLLRRCHSRLGVTKTWRWL